MNDSSSSSSSSSSASMQYATLIKTITELRTDLEKTVNKMQHLEKENTRSQHNYVKIKEELVETRRKYAEARENYHATVTEKLEAEKMYEDFMERVKIQLTEKTKEFEMLRDKFAPQDIDYIRIKLQEEMEIPHRHKIQQMEQEVETMREQYYSIRRELERCRAEFDAYSTNQRNEFASIHTENEGIIEALRTELYKYRNQNQGGDKDDIIRSQRLRIQELAQISDSMKEEVRDVTRERDIAVARMQEFQSKSEEVVSKLRARVALAEADRVAVEQRHVTLTQEIDRKESIIHGLRDKIDELTAQYDTLRTKNMDTEARLSEAKVDIAESQLQIKAQFTSELQEQVNEIERLSSRLADREEILRRSQRDATEMQIRTEAANNELGRSYQHKIQEMNAKEMSLNKEIEGLNVNFRRREMQHNHAYEKLLTEVEALKVELIPLRREKEILHLRVLDLESTLDNERKQHASLQREHSTAISSLQTRLKDTQTHSKELEALLNLAKTAESETQRHLAALTAQLQSSKTENARLVGAAQKETLDKVAAAESLLRAKAAHERKVLEAQLHKEKKRSTAYKEKALEAHRREKLISESALAAAVYGDAALPTMYEILGENWVVNAPTAVTERRDKGTGSAAAV